jgi:hypothetical protein
MEPKNVTLITENKPRLSQFGPGRAAPVDPGRRRGNQGCKGTSAYSSSYNEELEPVGQPITLPKIRPERHMAAFKRALERNLE